MRSQYMLDRWGIEKGFPGESVTAIAQSSDGYLWIGTDKGLIRFDGSNFRVFRQAILPSFTIGPVRALLADSAGNLWILLESTRILRYRDGKFELGREEAEFGITAVGRRKDGSVLLSSLAYGTLTYDGSKFELLQRSAGGPAESGATANSQTNDTLSSRLSWATSVASHHLAEPNSAATSLAESTDGKIWLGSQDRGLFSMLGERVSQTAPGRRIEKITCLLPLNDGKLWIGTERGLVVWDGAEATMKGVPGTLQHSEILSMLRDRDSHIWVGTTRGLARFDTNGDSSLAPPTLASNEPVTALFEDREGNLWAGSPRGIERLRQSTFVTFSVAALESQSGGPIYVDGEDRAWFAPFEGGLYWMKDGKTQAVMNDGLSRDVVYSIAGVNNELWIGRQQGGLTRLLYADGRITTKTYTQEDGLAQDGVYAVYRSADGSVWAATLSGGISKLSNGHFTTYSRANGMLSDTVSAIAQSPDGTMWFASPNGLNALSNEHWRAFTIRDGLPSDNVNCVLSDSAGMLWIGTASGLAVLNSGRIQRAGGGSESLHEAILGVAEDKNGRLWIATSNHILAATRNRLLGTELDQADVREYGLEDGLEGTEGVKRQPSVFADVFGRVWFSTNRGISVVETGRLVDSSPPAMMHIEGVMADGATIDLHQPIRVPPDEHRVTFSYSGLSLTVPDRVRFKYKLEGFDHSWSEPTQAREAVYTNLSPGSYRFRVIASNSNGQWNGAEAAIPFEVDRAAWQTLWFRLCGLLVIALAVLVFFRMRVLRLTRQMKLRFEERLAERTRIAQELHDTLLQGVISASMLLHVVNQQTPADSPSKPALDRILGLMTRVTEEGRNAVSGLRSLRNNSLDLGRAFSEIQQDFAGQEGVDFRVLVEGQARPLHPVIREEIYNIGREALTNAFRHARASRIEVELEYAPSGLRVLVRDSGIGFDSKVLQFGRDGHWGLSGMRERAKGIGARFRVLSRPEAGTEVELTVPSRVAFVPESPNGTSNWIRRFLPTWKQTIERTPSEQDQ